MRQPFFWTLLLLTLVLTVSVHAANQPGFQISGGYLMGNYSSSALGIEGVTAKAPAFLLELGVPLASPFGAKLTYQNGNLKEILVMGNPAADATYSLIDVLATYRIASLDQLETNLLGGWSKMTLNAASTFEGSGLALGLEGSTQLSETISARGSFLYAPSVSYTAGSSTYSGSATRLLIAATLTLPQSPVNLEGGYRSNSYNYTNSGLTVTDKYAGFFFGGRYGF